MSIIHELLQVNDEDKRRAREIFNKTEKDILRDLDILLQWLEKQPHLPKPHDEIRLEGFLLRNKFRIEQTKLKLDKYYTFRGIYSDFFTNMDPTCDTIKKIRKSIIWALMPKLTPSVERIIVFKVMENQVNIFTWKDLITYALLFLDLQFTYDYAVSNRYVIDMSAFTLKHVMKLDVNVASRGFFLLQQAFSGRISAFDYINPPPAMNHLLTLLKPLFGEKMFNKIKTHDTLESLYNVVPKDILPKDYGGNEDLLSILHEKWGEELSHQKDFLMENRKRVSNEKFRTGEPIHNDLFGMEGTFKKINLD